MNKLSIITKNDPIIELDTKLSEVRLLLCLLCGEAVIDIDVLHEFITKLEDISSHVDELKHKRG